MARSFDRKKLALWQGRFHRFLDSGLAVARFCAVEQVSESSFYYWRKKLGPQALRRLARAKHRDARATDRDARAKDCDARAKDRDARATDRYTRARGCGTGAKDRAAGVEYRARCAENYDTRAEGRGVFQPVVVTPSRCGVVVQLPGGTRIEVDADHLDAIRAVVAEAVRVDHGLAAGRNVSSDNQVIRSASSGNQVIRSVTSDNRSASSGNQVMRKRGGAVSC